MPLACICPGDAELELASPCAVGGVPAPPPAVGVLGGIPKLFRRRSSSHHPAGPGTTPTSSDAMTYPLLPIDQAHREVRDLGFGSICLAGV